MGNMSGIAYDGKPFEPHDYVFAEVEDGEDNRLTTSFADMADEYNRPDHLDISTINVALIRTVKALALTTADLKVESKKLAEAETRWKHEYNVALMCVSGGTEKSRIAAAELASEAEFNEMKLQQAKVQELKNLSGTIRAALDTYQSVSNNLRAEMKVM